MPPWAPLLLAVTCAVPLRAQQWQPGQAIALVARASAVRDSRDRLLSGWHATAHGLVRFTAMVEHEGTSVERVIRADELRVEVYGEAPSRSKQRIVAWRDTVFQPTPITYHRDHLGIVTNDFGPRIRLGQGDEVRDVVQPLSPEGLEHYRFRLGDTLRIASGDRTLTVVAVDVRPTDPDAAGVIGRLYLDADRAALVRFRFTFTAASYRDPTVASITVELENALSGQQWWLPRRQAIVIRRAEPLLALPITTVLRADWTIDDYVVGLQLPTDQWTGPPIAGLREPADSAWDVPLATRLAELPVVQDEIEAMRALAADLAPAARLDGLPLVRFLGRDGLSDVLRANRVEGIALGAGIRVRVGGRDRLDLSGSLATASGQPHGAVAWRHGQEMALTLTAEDRIADLAEGQHGSRLANSIATLVGGDDAGEWFRLRRLSLALDGVVGSATRWSAALSRESAGNETTRLREDRLRPDPALGGTTATVLRGRLDRSLGAANRWSLAVEGGVGSTDWWRAALDAAGQAGPLQWAINGGLGSGDLPSYRSFVAGGRGSLVGVPIDALGGRRLVRMELGWPVAVAMPVPLGPALARTVLASRIIPYVAAGVVGGRMDRLPWRADGQVETVLGLRLDLWGPLLRIDLGWWPRGGRLGLGIDAHPDWWPLL